MQDWKLTGARLREGVWEGVVSAVSPDADSHAGTEAPKSGTPKSGIPNTGIPNLEALYLERPLPDLMMSRVPGKTGHWAVRVPIPAAVLSDGVQVIMLRDIASGMTLGAVGFVAGDAVDENLRAEIELLRAELDMLKRAFRRHCLETGG